MKFLLTFFAALLVCSSTFAQGLGAPQRMSYQGVVRNNSGALVANRSVRLRATLLVGLTAAQVPIYVETHTATTNANGLLSLQIGGGTVVSGRYPLSFENGPFSLRTEIDPNGGTNYTITATSDLLSVPYASYADYAGRVQGHYVGELFGGGIICHVWKEFNGAEHGLIVSLNDLASRAPWGGSGTRTNAQSPKNGAANTATIVSALGVNSAAGLCDGYASGGFTDWYLPANWELAMLHNQIFAINEVLDTDNNPLTTSLSEGGAYLSSTERNSTDAYALLMPDGRIVDTTPKTALNAVRAVRRF